MKNYFGIVPSAQLQQKITAFQEHQTSGEEKLYLLRDELLQAMVQEQVQAIFLSVIDLLPDGSQKQMMEKLTGVVKSTTQSFVKNLVGKGTNAEIQESTDFINNELLVLDADAVQRVAFVIDDAMLERKEALFTEVANGNAVANSKELEHFFGDLGDLVLEYYIIKLADSFNLGFVKRKAVPLAKSTMSKGVKMGNSKLFPTVGQTEFSDIINYYSHMFFKV